MNNIDEIPPSTEAERVFLRIPQPGMKEVYHHLKVFVRYKRKGKAVLTFDGTTVYFATPDMQVGALAEGNWPGQARIGMAALMAIAATPPDQDPLIIQVADGNLQFGPTFSCHCTWRQSKEPLIRLPINYTDATLTALSLRNNTEEIEASGLAEHVTMAKRRLHNRLKTATRALAHYHVTEKSLRELVENSLKNAGVLRHISQTDPNSEQQPPPT